MQHYLLDEIHNSFDRIDVSIDIETLGANRERDDENWDPRCAPVEAKSKVIQVGIAVFDPFAISDEKTLKKYSFAVNIHHDQPGRVATQSTIDWWGKQNPEVWHNLCQDQIDIAEAMMKIEVFVAKVVTPETRLWYRGDAFDHTILQDALFQFGRQLKVPFWNVRDVRSPEDVLWGGGKQKAFRIGDHHDALHDAMSQARLVQEFYRVTESIRAY